MQSGSEVTFRKAMAWSLALILGMFALVVIRRAWICDDAYITFRTVDNFVNGYRLTWNITERVQAYTHPLWMLVLSLFYFFTREIYFTSLVISIGVSLLAVYLMARHLAVSLVSAIFGVFVLTLSKGFVDFSTSGLENPLSHLLVVVFCILYFYSTVENNRHVGWLSLVASLGMVNRLDLGLIFFVPLVITFLHRPTKKAFWMMVVGQFPLIAWEVFSIFYYGFPFPNTAYAKLNTGIPQIEMTRQGLLYLLNAVQFDMITPLMIAAGVLAGLILANHKTLPLVIGILFYLLYIVQVGGDFMSGRFLTVPLLCALILIVRHDLSTLPSTLGVLLFVVALVFGLNVVNPTVRVNDLGPIDSGPIHLWNNGILDERLLYYGGSGLLNAQRDVEMPTFYWGMYGAQAKNSGRKVADNYGIGFFGFYAGPQVYVLDKLALADPLLARLPAMRKVNWRVGHYERIMPEGYLQTLHLGRNVIADPNLALYYDKLSLIVKGSLFDLRRLVEIWKMNTGQYDYLIDRDYYRYPGMQHIDLDSLPETLENGTSCNASGVIQLQDSGVEVRLPTISHASHISISLDHNDRYQLHYLLGKQEVAIQNISPAYLPEPGGLMQRELNVPARAISLGYDRLRVFPLSGEEGYCLGTIRLAIP